MSSSTSAHQPPPQRILVGILFICLAGALFSVMTGSAKYLATHYSSLQISWARAFGHILFLLAAFLPRHGLKVLRTARPVTQLARSALLFTSNLATFFALAFIPLAKAASISLTAPLIVTMLAGPMLGERTTLPRVIALLCGFAGVLLVIRPGSAVFHWAALVVLVSATSYAVYQILTRKVAGVESPETSAFYSSVVGAFGMLLVMPFVWITPHGWLDILLFCGVGVLGALGHYCIAIAFGFGPANILSPFQYFQLLSSVTVGFLAFGEVPDAFTWIGAAVIVASGIFIGLNQARRPKGG
ncbi:DMT family transporter [Roseomonas sp. HJA6]|uniref:DMT family transporter n=1 Tax=Roseomonas alba TaxID=2846776 RepID=A0ABS7AC83_9PROT|nr:DMT family transporter [Neoroseomonas alba]